MKIAIDIRHLGAPHQAGVGKYTLKLISELAQLAPDDQFFLFASGRPQTLAYLPKFTAPNITVIEKNIPNRLLFLLFLLKIKTIESLLPEQPDIWLFPNHNIIHTKIPYALTVHDISFDIFPAFFTLKDRLRYKLGRAKEFTQKAKHIFAVSESTRRDLIDRWNIDPSKVTATPLGVDSKYNGKELPSDSSYLSLHKIRGEYLLCLCTREPRKNLEAVIEAYASCDNLPNLVIAGGRGWKSKTLDEVIKKSGVKHRIQVIGYVPEKHKPALYRHAKAFLFPSFYEGFGLPAAEAIACGTPVIASSTGSLPEIVSKNAILVDPFNVTDLVQALKMVNEKKTQDKPEHSWSDTAKRTYEILKNLS
ncbi:glycosyltransferase family 4 protein [Candidatus Uhrbacteria bacterium]|jgi:glycosyltransferase involved in cell wall biosynthesis|nr:glycosyltransferase family 4 protein [Candidatus Uhrbacteria bacterium]